MQVQPGKQQKLETSKNIISSTNRYLVNFSAIRRLWRSVLLHPFGDSDIIERWREHLRSVLKRGSPYQAPDIEIEYKNVAELDINVEEISEAEIQNGMSSER